MCTFEQLEAAKSKIDSLKIQIHDAKVQRDTITAGAQGPGACIQHQVLGDHIRDLEKQLRPVVAEVCAQVVETFVAMTQRNKRLMLGTIDRVISFLLDSSSEALNFVPKQLLPLGAKGLSQHHHKIDTLVICVRTLQEALEPIAYTTLALARGTVSYDDMYELVASLESTFDDA
ncbi:hypothetical protein PG993_002379 [Apiospora rasikravindrae]|uniref:Uncharacterized protein n=1 Tax=Apiospora rasikravindrae TaxID=990691 RepID=A0ABR1TWH0_9PEZI